MKKVSYLCAMEKDQINIFKRVRDLYNKYSIKSVTMDDIARELGISKKTLYTCVRDKEELVSKIVEEELSEIGKIMDEIELRPLNAIEMLIETNRALAKVMKNQNPSAYYDLKKYYPDIFSNMLKVRRQRMYDTMYRNLQQGKKEGLFREDLNVDIITKVHVMKVELMSEHDFMGNFELKREEVFREIFIYHLRGVCNSRGIEVFEKLVKQINNNANE